MCFSNSPFINSKVHPSLVPRHPHWKRWKARRTRVWEWTQSLQCSQRQSLCLWLNSPENKKETCSSDTAQQRQPSDLGAAHLSVDHVRDHHDLVALGVRKFQREFSGLYIKRQNNWVLQRKAPFLFLITQDESHGLCLSLNNRLISTSYRSLYEVISSYNLWWVITASVANVVPVSLEYRNQKSDDQPGE